MMIDKQLMFFDNEAINTSKSSRALDVGANLGEGMPVFVRASVSDDFSGGTSLSLTLQDSADGITFDPVLTSAVVPVASLKAGYHFAFGSVPRKLGRHLRLNATVAGTMSAGKLNAFIAQDN